MTGFYTQNSGNIFEKEVTYKSEVTWIHAAALLSSGSHYRQKPWKWHTPLQGYHETTYIITCRTAERHTLWFLTILGRQWPQACVITHCGSLQLQLYDNHYNTAARECSLWQYHCQWHCPYDISDCSSDATTCTSSKHTASPQPHCQST